MDKEVNNILKFKTGETFRLKELFSKYFTELVRYCARIVNNTSDAEEIVQDVFVTLWEKRYSIHIEHSLFDLNQYSRIYLYIFTEHFYIILTYLFNN